MVWRRMLLVVLSIPMLWAGRAEAQGFIIPELGARKNGMSAAVGRPDDLSAIYHNPGALALLRGTQLMVNFGTVFLNIDVRLAPWAGSEPYLTEPLDSDGYFPKQEPSVFTPMPMIGASTNLWSDKLVGALGIYVPNAAGATFGENKPTRYHIIDAYVLAAFFTAAVAYRPWPWLAVGIGGSAVYLRISRRSLLFPVINGEDYGFLLGKETEIEIEGEDLKPAITLGIQVWPHRTISLGFMMLSRYDVQLEGPLRLKPGEDANPLMESPNVTENEHLTTIIAPWIFAFGANWNITPWLEVGAELRLYLNSLVKEQRTTITEGKVLPTLLPDDIVTPKNLHDSVHVGGGFIVRPPISIDLELMAGAGGETASSPDNTVEVSAPSFDIINIHAGVRWRINERYRVALLYGHYRYLERETKDSITSPPTNFIGSGYSNMFTLVLEGQIAPGIGVSP